MNKRFEIRTTIGGWDNKWVLHSPSLYTHPSNLYQLFLVSKFVASPSPTKKSSAKVQAPGVVAKAIPTEPDGSIIHAVSIVHICFKSGRITVPPAIVLATNGFSVPPPPSESSTAPSAAYSSTNPPPHWTSVKELASPKYGGNFSKYLAFLGTGWKDLPENERWWETAMGGEIETRRAAAMADLSGLRRGLEAATTL
jgi:hypothetical protein